jgi:ribonuclease J
LRERVAISKYGYVTASVSIDEDGSIADGPYVSARGLSEEDGSLADESLDAVEAACDEALDGLSRRKRLDDEVVETLLVRAIRRTCERVFGRKPLVDVTIMRV